MSLLSYKSIQTPHFVKKKKKRLLDSFPGLILSLVSLISLPNTSKHLQTPQILIFSLQSSRQCSCTQSSFPWFQSLDLRFRGVDVAFQLQSTPFFSLLFFLPLFCLIKFFYCFSQHVLAFQHVFIAFQVCFLAYAMIYRFDVVGLAFLGQDMSIFNVCAQIHMILGFLPC